MTSSMIPGTSAIKVVCVLGCTVPYAEIEDSIVFFSLRIISTKGILRFTSFALGLGRISTKAQVTARKRDNAMIGSKKFIHFVDGRARRDLMLK